MSTVHDSGDGPESIDQIRDFDAGNVELYGAMSFGVSRMISASMKTSLGY